MFSSFCISNVIALWILLTYSLRTMASDWEMEGLNQRYNNDRESSMIHDGSLSNLRNNKVCALPRDHGHGKHHYSRWYYDNAAMVCIHFVYRGSGGNDNRFFSYQECSKTCNIRCYQPVPDSHDKSDGPDCDGGGYEWSYHRGKDMCYDFRTSSCSKTDTGNRFPTKHECKQYCIHNGTDRLTTESDTNKEGGPFAVPMPTPDRGTDRLTTESDTNKEVCALPRDYGNGIYTYSRWYYDNAAMVCKPLRYRGYGGNDNRFFSFEECSKTCNSRCYQSVPISHDISHGPDCVGGGFEWYYHTDRDVCLPFRTSSCHMMDTGNRFPTKYECKQDCIPNGTDRLTTEPTTNKEVTDRLTTEPTTYKEGTDRLTTEPTTNKEETCELPKDHGTGIYVYSRWYYDNTAKVCKPLRYGGYGGNDNRFFSHQECSIICNSRCYQSVPIGHDISHGPDCVGGGFEWYYHTDRDKCLPFRTSSCHTDTGNRFPTKHECQQDCTILNEHITLPAPCVYYHSRTATCTSSFILSGKVSSIHHEIYSEHLVHRLEVVVGDVYKGRDSLNIYPYNIDDNVEIVSIRKILSGPQCYNVVEGSTYMFMGYIQYGRAIIDHTSYVHLDTPGRRLKVSHYLTRCPSN